METLALYIVAATLGAMLFFAVGIAPTVFQALPIEQAGLFLRKIFPRYYLALIVGSGLAGCTVSGVPRRGCPRRASVVVVVVGATPRFRDESRYPTRGRPQANRPRSSIGECTARLRATTLSRLSRLRQTLGRHRPASYGRSVG